MSEHEQTELWEKSLQGGLTPAEQERFDSWLAVRPELRPDWEAEAALCQAVRQLPDVPVSSNFTSLVMQAVVREEGRKERGETAAASGFMYWLRRHLVQLSASTAVVAIAGILAFRQHGDLKPAAPPDLATQEMAEQIKGLAAVSPVPSVDTLKDYEAIRRLSQMSAEPDLELLAALQ